MRALTDRAGQLRAVQRKLEWLVQQRRSIGFSPADEAEYQRLVDRERQLIRPVV